MKKILTPKNVLFFLFILFVVVVAFLYINSQKNKNLSQTTIYPLQENEKGWSSYGTLIPGSSTEQELLSGFGKPLTTKQVGEVKKFEYKGTNVNWNNEIVVKTEKVVFIKKIISQIDRITTKTVEAEFGETKTVLYGPYTEVGFLLYVYPTKGFAYLGNKEGNTILELWYFDPTLTIDELIDLYAPEYSKSKDSKNQMIDKAPDNI